MNTNMKQLKDIIFQSTNEPLPRITAIKKCSFVAHSIKLCISLAMVLFLVVLNSVPSYGSELRTTTSAIRTRLLSSNRSVTYFYHVPQVGSYTEENVLISGLALTDSSTEYLVASLYDDVYLAFLYRENLYPSVYFLSSSSHSNGVYIYDDEFNYAVWDLSLINGQTDIYSVATAITTSPASSYNIFSGSVSDLYSAFADFISSSVTASVHWTNGSVSTPLFATDTPTFTVSSSVANPAYVLCASLPDINNVSVTLVASTSAYVDTSSTIDISDGRSLALSNTLSVGGYTFYYRNPNSGTSGILSRNPDFPYFDTTAEAFAAFADFLDSQIPSSNYSLPNGNVLYIDIGSGNDYFFNFLTYMPDTSAILGSPWANSQYYLWSDSLPSTTTFSASDGTYITWRKSPTDRNLFGQTKTAISELSGTAPSRYLVIVNPLIYAQSTNKFNGLLKVNNIPNGTTIYSYPLNAYLSDGVYVNDVSSNGGTGTAVSSGGNINTVSIDDSTVDYSAPSGGLNWQESSQSIAEDVRGLKESLSDFFNNVLTLLGKPVGYIQQLISAGSDMMQHVSGLWSWLPDDVSSMLTSSLIVMVGVAVFKVFL